MDNRPLCVSCNTRYRAAKNGVTVRVGDDGVCFGDLYRCPSCKHEMVTGWGRDVIYAFDDDPDANSKLAAWREAAIGGD